MGLECWGSDYKKCSQNCSQLELVVVVESNSDVDEFRLLGSNYSGSNHKCGR